MSSTYSIINLGKLSKTATVLIEKASDAVGGLFKPWQIRRVAQAEAEADKIEAIAEIEISELQQRATHRFFAEEAKKQANMESITRKAINDLRDDARPDKVEDDWISNFFDKCRLTSDDEMQRLWARVLAGEANKPGSYSRRTVNLVSALDKSDAMLFTKLCSYCWFIGQVQPLIYDLEHDIYVRNGIRFSALQHLDDIGLVTFDYLGGYERQGFPQQITIHYYGELINLRFRKEKDNTLETGNVMLTKTGGELAPICGSEPVPGFLDFVLDQWRRKRYVMFSDWPRKVVPADG